MVKRNVRTESMPTPPPRSYDSLACSLKNLKVVISREEFLLAESKLKFFVSKSSDSEIQKKNRKNEISRIEKLISVLTNMSDEALLYHNLAQIDENDVMRRVSSLRESQKTNKSPHPFQLCTIVWVEWRYKRVNIMWPATLVKTRKPQHATVQYFSQEESHYHIKKNLNQIKLFFGPGHFEFKKTAIAHASVSIYDFMFCYTRALTEFVKFLSECEQPSQLSESS